MRRRQFTLKNTAAALLYVSQLLMAGYRFEVVPFTGHVDVLTPFELAPDDFPRVEWLKR